MNNDINIKCKNEISIRKSKTLPIENIIYDYEQNGMSMSKISKKYNISLDSIRTNLIKSGIKIRTGAKARQPFFNENFFENIDSEEKAYFLGLLITDGSIGKVDLKNNHPNRSVRIQLHSHDRHILEQFCEVTGHTKNICDSKTRPHSSITFYSNKMVEDLLKYGVTERKTWTTFLPQIEEKYMPHLIRGLIDGDGWISTTNEGKKCIIGFCGNMKIVQELRDYLIERLGIYKISICTRNDRPYTNDFGQISWAGKHDCTTLINYLYKNAHIYLNRKKANADLFLNINNS